MADEPNYSKRELDHFLGDIKTQLNKQDETLIEILTQTTRHNGRMSKLEIWKNIIVWTFVTIILPSIFFLLNKYL